MKLTKTIQYYGTTTAFVIVLNTSSIAATPCNVRQAAKSTHSTPIASPKTAGDLDPLQLLLGQQRAVPVIAAPLWLIERRKALQQMPPPTLQRMRIQWKA
jgi:hypothetical protein